MAIRRWCEARGAVLVIDAEQGYRFDRCKHCGEPTGKGTTRIIRGFPDLVVFWPSPRPVWWIECKRHDGRQTEHQKAFQRRCEEAGQVYLLARSVDDVMEFEARSRAA
ncbi:VRR-NUC domain-containing protein [Thioalkalivibrio sp.]|uniref:VRR-NUC domain-containing protein n=1 Tax=Thioalkalivibrio sp. TaxID=2093813 RepID=UPI00356696E2